MSSQSHESLDHQLLELIEEFASLATKHVDVLLSQLEGHRLKVEVAWAVREHEAKVDVHHVASRVKQDVSVVPVLDLQDVAQERIPYHGSHEVLLGGLVPPDVLLALRYDLQGFLSADSFQARQRSGREIGGADAKGGIRLCGRKRCFQILRYLLDARLTFISEGLDEVLPQSLDVRVLFLQLIDRDCIWNRLNQATSRTSSDNVKWLEPDLEVVRLKNCLELLDQLRRELLLGQVVGAFDYHRNQPIVRDFAIYALLLRFPAHLAECSLAKET